MTYKWLNEDERLLLGLLKAHSGDEYIDLNPDVVLGMLINLAAERERNAELKAVVAVLASKLGDLK